MKLRLFAAAAVLLWTAAVASSADSSWTGWITDSSCGAKGAHEGAAECAKKCVKEHGAKYVFVNEADKKVFVVDAQDKAAAHAGEHVTVKGSVEGETLKLSSIEAAK